MVGEHMTSGMTISELDEKTISNESHSHLVTHTYGFDFSFFV